jgi:hypothetical protein
LARAPGIAGAVTGSSAIAAAASEEARFLVDNGLSRSAAVVMMDAIHHALEDLARKGQDPAARRLLARLNAIQAAPQEYDFDVYVVQGEGEEPLSLVRIPAGQPVAEQDASGWDRLQTYLGVFGTTLETLGQVLAQDGEGYELNGEALAQRDLEDLGRKKREIEARQQAFYRELSRTQTLVRAFQYVRERLLE